MCKISWTRPNRKLDWMPNLKWKQSSKTWWPSHNNRMLLQPRYHSSLSKEEALTTFVYSNNRIISQIPSRSIKTLPLMPIRLSKMQEITLLCTTSHCISTKWPVNKKVVNNKGELVDYVMEARLRHLIFAPKTLNLAQKQDQSRTINIIIRSLTRHMAVTSFIQGIWVTSNKYLQLKRSRWIWTGKLRFTRPKRT